MAHFPILGYPISEYGASIPVPWTRFWDAKMQRARKRRTFTYIGLSVVCMVSLASCQEPADQALKTGGTEAQFNASLEAIYPKLTADQQEAFHWAVGDYNLGGLDRDYPNGSPRQIVQGQARRLMPSLSDRIRELEQQKAQQQAILADLAHIEALAPTFVIEPSDFGQQPTIRAVIKNGSSRVISKARWEAAMYLDNRPRPVIKSVVLDDYRRRGGLAPGASLSTTIPLEMAFGDNAWKSLEIQQARSRHVTLKALPESVLDEGGRPVLAPGLNDELAELKALQDKLQAYAVL